MTYVSLEALVGGKLGSVAAVMTLGDVGSGIFLIVPRH